LLIAPANKSNIQNNFNFDQRFVRGYFYTARIAHGPPVRGHFYTTRLAHGPPLRQAEKAPSHKTIEYESVIVSELCFFCSSVRPSSICLSACLFVCLGGRVAGCEQTPQPTQTQNQKHQF
jgi:hypothetical protein